MNYTPSLLKKAAPYVWCATSTVATVAGVAALIYEHREAIAGAYHYFRPQRNAEHYYTLPPKDTEPEARVRAMEEDLREAQAELENDDEDACILGRHPRCSCCHELRARYAFVPCGHMCICEPCLILHGHNHQEQSGKTYRGPCKPPCPMCRGENLVIKMFTV